MESVKLIFHLLGMYFLITCAQAGSGTAPHEIDCQGQPDGLLEIGCWGYANCNNEVPDIHECTGGTVLERESMTCIKPGEGKTDCYLAVECTGKADGSYADKGDNCITYYRCQGEIILGRFYCPANLAFNENLQICDYKHNMEQPCGTLPPKHTTTKTTTSKPTTEDTTTTATTTTTAPTTTSTASTTKGAANTTVFTLVVGADSTTPQAVPAAPVIGK